MNNHPELFFLGLAICIAALIIWAISGHDKDYRKITRIKMAKYVSGRESFIVQVFYSADEWCGWIEQGEYNTMAEAEAAAAKIYAEEIEKRRI